MRSWILAGSAAGLAIGLSACGDEPGLDTETVLEQAQDLQQPKPGLYAQKTQLVEFNVPGLPPAQADRFRTQMSGLEEQQQPYCLTRAQAQRGFEDMLRSVGEASNGMVCTFSRFDVDAPNLDAMMGCTGPMGARADIGFQGQTTDESLDLEMDMAAHMPVIPGGSMEMRFAFTSERIGDCSPQQIADAERMEAEAAAALGK